MFVLIAGGGRTGAQLASLLLAQNHRVHLVESRREILARLHRELPTEIIYEGHPTDPQVLDQAGINEAEVLAEVQTTIHGQLAERGCDAAQSHGYKFFGLPPAHLRIYRVVIQGFRWIGGLDEAAAINVVERCGMVPDRAAAAARPQGRPPRR